MTEVADTGADQETATKETAGVNGAAVFETVQKAGTTKSQAWDLNCSMQTPAMSKRRM